MTLGIGTPLASIEALWAKHTVHLAAEPEGERSGIVHAPASSSGANAEGAVADSIDSRDVIQTTPNAVSATRDTRVDADASEPLTLCAVGDSMVAGCGTTNQRDGVIPAIARQIARVTGRDVAWQAHGRLGATMRRVRYRLLPEVLEAGERFDMLIICAGSNDIMANRKLSEWRADLDAVLEEAQPLSDRIVVLSPGQMQHEPSLGRALRRALEREMDEQAAVSKEVCAKRNATYVDMIHEDVHATEPGFFSPDRFHPSAQGYRYMAAGVVAKLDGVL